MKKKLNGLLSEENNRIKDLEEQAQMNYLCKFFNGSIQDDNLVQSLESNLDDKTKFINWCNKYKLDNIPYSRRLCLYIISTYGMMKCEGAIYGWLNVYKSVASRFKEKVRDIQDYYVQNFNNRNKGLNHD